jgi:hypothetical protein
MAHSSFKFDWIHNALDCAYEKQVETFIQCTFPAKLNSLIIH